MKCIRANEKGLKAGLDASMVIRVTNTKAAAMVKGGLYMYENKTEWKNAGRERGSK